MHNTDAHNPPVTLLLRWMTAVEALVVLISGAGLFLLPEVIKPLWPWELAPFNARAMGALYFTSLIAAAVMAWRGRWSPARVVTPMIFTFTLIVLIVSLVYLPRFSGASALAWFGLYIGIPIIAAYHLWLYRSLPPADALPTPSWLRTCLLAYAGFFLVYGMAMLVIPITATAFWPWGIDEFHGRMYSVGFITPAVGCLLLLRSGSALEFGALGLTQVFGGVTSLLGVLIVDSSVHRVDWTLLGSWAWFGFPLLLIIVGGLMALHARRMQG